MFKVSHKIIKKMTFSIILYNMMGPHQTFLKLQLVNMYSHVSKSNILFF